MHETKCRDATTALQLPTNDPDDSRLMVEVHRGLNIAYCARTPSGWGIAGPGLSRHQGVALHGHQKAPSPSKTPRSNRDQDNACIKMFFSPRGGREELLRSEMQEFKRTGRISSRRDFFSSHIASTMHSRRGPQDASVGSQWLTDADLVAVHESAKTLTPSSGLRKPDCWERQEGRIWDDASFTRSVLLGQDATLRRGEQAVSSAERRDGDFDGTNRTGLPNVRHLPSFSRGSREPTPGKLWGDEDFIDALQGLYDDARFASLIVCTEHKHQARNHWQPDAVSSRLIRQALCDVSSTSSSIDP